MTRTLLALAVLAMPACATVDGFEAEVAKLKDQPIQSVVAKLGTPDSEQKAAGRTTYVWTSQTRVANMPIATTTTSYATGRPNTVETINDTGPPRPLSCTLRLFVDAAGFVGKTEWEGSNVACATFAQRLATKG